MLWHTTNRFLICLQNVHIALDREICVIDRIYFVNPKCREWPSLKLPFNIRFSSKSSINGPLFSFVGTQPLKAGGVPYREKTSHFFKVFNQLRFIATKTSTYGHWTIGYCAQIFKLHDVKFPTNQVKNKIRSCVGTFGTFMGMGCTFNMLPTLYRAGRRSTISDGACRAKDA